MSAERLLKRNHVRCDEPSENGDTLLRTAMCLRTATLLVLLLFAPALQGCVSSATPQQQTSTETSSQPQSVNSYLTTGKGRPGALVGSMYRPSETASGTTFHLDALECISHQPLPKGASDGARVEVTPGGFESGAQVVTSMKVLAPAFAAGIKLDLAAQGLILVEGGFGDMQLSDETTSTWTGYVDGIEDDPRPHALISDNASALNDVESLGTSPLRLYEREGFAVVVFTDRFTEAQLEIVDHVLGPPVR